MPSAGILGIENESAEQTGDAELLGPAHIGCVTSPKTDAGPDPEEATLRRQR